MPPSGAAVGCHLLEQLLDATYCPKQVAGIYPARWLLESFAGQQLAHLRSHQGCHLGLRPG
jgi:hypothetical protein